MRTGGAGRQGRSAGARAEEPDAPVGEAIADPKLREARKENDAILSECSPAKARDRVSRGLIEKTKGFQSFSVKSQKLVRDDAAEFGGILKGPKGQAGFRLTLVKQTGGRWAIATFSGPNPE